MHKTVDLQEQLLLSDNILNGLDLLVECDSKDVKILHLHRCCVALNIFSIHK